MDTTISVRLHDPSMSHQEVAAAIERALNPRPDGANGMLVESYGRGWKWAREIWDDKLIYEDNGRQYQVKYTMKDDGSIELGEPQEVVSKTVYVKAAEDLAEGGITDPEFDSMKTFLSRLRDTLKGSIDADTWKAAVASARGHAGGKAPRRKKAGEGDDDFVADDGRVYSSDPDVEISIDNDSSGAEAELNRINDGLDTIVAEGRMYGPTPSTVLFNEFTFADPPEWIPFLPKPGTYKHPKYGEIKITKKRAKQFVKNFADGVYQDRIAIDAEHQSKLSGALGWITEMKQNDDGSVDARAEWTSRGVKLIEDNRFKYFSPEWYESWPDPATEIVHTDVAIGGALTTKPFFKHGSLRPLVAREGRLFSTDADEPTDDGADPVRFEAFEFAGADDEGGAIVPDPTPITYSLSEEEYKSFTEMQRQMGELTAAKEAAEQTALTLSEKVVTIEKDRRRDRLTAIAQGKSDTNAKPFVGEVEKHVAFMERLADGDGGEQNEDLQFYIQQQVAFAEATASVFTEVGSGQSGSGGDAWEKATAMAQELREKQPELTLDQARAKVFSENPTLAAQA